MTHLPALPAGRQALRTAMIDTFAGLFPHNFFTTSIGLKITSLITKIRFSDRLGGTHSMMDAALNANFIKRTHKEIRIHIIFPATDCKRSIVLKWQGEVVVNWLGGQLPVYIE